MEITNSYGVQFANGLPKVVGSKSLGGQIDMLTENANHLRPGAKPVEPDKVAGGFASALNDALGMVEKLDVNSQKLTAKAVYEPDSVEAHTVVIAAEKARFALNLTKSIADGFVRTYRDLTNPR